MVIKQTEKILTVSVNYKIGQAGCLLRHPRTQLRGVVDTFMERKSKNPNNVELGSALFAM